MSESASFCPHCGQERVGVSHRLLREPPAKPNFTDRVVLQGSNASRLLFVFLATLFGSSVFVGLFFGNDTSGLLFASVALAGATMLCAIPEKRELRRLFRAARLWRPTPWLIVLGVTPFLPLLANAWLYLIGMDDMPEGANPFADLSPGMAILIVCIFPGIFEELAFRGVVFGNLRHMLRPGWAHLLTAALFAGMHFSPIIFPYHLCIGLYLGWLRARSGTLPVPMFAHALHNAAIIFIYSPS